MANTTGVPDCFNAQTFLGAYENGTINPDIGGACVAISNILINLLLPFLVKWSSDDADVSASIFLLYSQTIPLLFATLFSINSTNLSLFDAHFTVAVTASPMSVYIASCCALERCGVKTRLFRKMSDGSPETKAVIVWLGLTLPILWLSVSVVTSFSPTAFRNSSNYCQGVTIPLYLEFLIASSVTGVLDVMGRRDLIDDLVNRRGLGLASLLGLWIWGIYLVRHREEIVRKWKESHRTYVVENLCVNEPGAPAVKRPYGRLLKRSAVLAWYLPKLCWDIIIHHHPTMLVWLLFNLHWSWILGIVTAITFDRTQSLSYGQLLSLAAPIPGLIAFTNIFRKNWRNVKSFIFKIPSLLSEGLCFIATGKEKWTEQRELNPDYFDWSGRRWAIVLFGWLAVSGLHAVWIWSYVRAGTEPNLRLPPNNPHRNWKPYSVMMYIGGCFVTLVNMFITVAGFDYYQKWFFSPCPEEKPRRRSPSFYVLHAFGLTISLLLATVLCVTPFFGPFAALPLSQEWHWLHECASFPTEIILTGQSNPNISSTISFYMSTLQVQPGSQPPQKQHAYDFDFINVPGYKLLQYRPVDTTPLSEEPGIKTMFLDMSQNKIFGCSSTFSQDSIEALLANPEAICSDATGTYDKDPYLTFSISTASPPMSIFTRTEAREYAFSDDAPSFKLRFANPDGSLTDRTLLRSAVTKRNSPNVLKVCSNAAASAEVLGPLSLFTDALNQFTLAIDRPRVYFL